MADGLKNRFNRNEWSGALGDLGTLLPLAFALMIYNGFPPARLFFLWGLVYVVSGFFYKTPVSVQPLKAMSVIAIATGFTPAQLSSTAFFYGLLMVLLALGGVIDFLKRLFSPALVRGIQLGIGFILAQKAIQLVLDKGLLIHYDSLPLWWAIGLLVAAFFLLVHLPNRWRTLVIILLIGLSILLVKVLGLDPIEHPAASPAKWTSPDFSFLIDAFFLLMLPQLPLTLGNAVFAANDACHTLWGGQASRVTPKRLGLSIGVSDMIIGLLGGFPICHGAGGMAAHARFGAKTGGATIIIGSLFVLLSLFPRAAPALFYIPVPFLGAMLLFNSWQMMTLFLRLEAEQDKAVAILVGLVSFFTRNLTVALAAGFFIEKSIYLIKLKLGKEQAL
ncbi:MAG: hypothetical protein GXO75_05790 [Calditrichaeota bacterium]|nr:hypothetical protein [Calditrichota bacterium]